MQRLRRRQFRRQSEQALSHRAGSASPSATKPIKGIPSGYYRHISVSGLCDNKRESVVAGTITTSCRQVLGQRFPTTLRTECP
ncbi:hypothetical protein AAVH_04978 [Aphelenchoides avenae]|nr:hypothetical protein AAVH_04978 [Aphelenchus avenae]